MLDAWCLVLGAWCLLSLAVLRLPRRATLPLYEILFSLLFYCFLTTDFCLVFGILLFVNVALNF